MRGLAGFPPKERSFYLERMCLEPPDELKSLVFPEADSWLEQIGEGNDAEYSIAACKFLKLMINLRTVLFQDAAVLWEFLPASIRDHSIFKSDVFQLYRRDLLATMANTPDPIENRIQQVLPDLARHIQSIGTHLSQQLAGNLGGIQTKLDYVSSQIDDLWQGRVTLNISGSATISPPASSYLDLSHLSNSSTSSTATSNSQATITNNQPSPRSPRAANNENVEQNGTSVEIVDPTRLKMSRGVSTIGELWKEWTVGLGALPSVEQREAKYGTSWRPGSESKWFNRRKVIIGRVKAVMQAENLNEVAAVERVEQERAGRSLDKFSKALTKGNAE